MENLPILTEDSKLVLSDNHGKSNVEIKYIENTPSYREKLDGNGIKQIKTILGESIKSIANIPNKTLEIRFNPEIAQGLKDGSLTLLKTQDGEVLADAINSSGKIVGKGRISTNFPKQLTTVGFQLISFAVAQSHLQDITYHLKKIESLCNSIKEKLDQKDLIKMNTDTEYLEGIIDKIRKFSDPYLISELQKSEIEKCIKNFIEHKNTIISDFNGLIDEIRNQKDEDTFGTENTYKSLKSKQFDYYKIMQRVEILNKIFILLRIITSYIDPKGCVFSHSLVNISNFSEELNKLQSEYIKQIDDKIESLLSKATFNASDTLELRKENIKLNSREQNNLFKTIKDTRAEVLGRLDKHLEILNEPKEIRYALSFNEVGEIKEAVLI